MLLLVWLLGTDWHLASETFPVHAQKTPAGLYWVHCDLHGQTTLLHEQSGELASVALPPTTLAISFHPNKALLAILTRNQWSCYAIQGAQLGERIWQKPGQINVPAWLILPCNAESILIPEHKGWSILNWSTGDVQSLTMNTPLSSDGLLFPDPVPSTSGWYFQNQAQFLHMDPQSIKASPLPDRRDMEQVFALDEFGHSWFFFGGQSADLDSFGWHVEPKGPSEKKVIVLKWGLDPQQPKRLILFTVASQVRSQLAASLFGHITVTGEVLLREENQWRRLKPFSFDLNKDKPEQPFQTAWSWTTDLNRDGMGDLVISQDGKKIEIFLSQADGSFGPSQKVDQPNDRMLFLPDQMFTLQKKSDYISIQKWSH